jgi:hypothetical protein
MPDVYAEASRLLLSLLRVIVYVLRGDIDTVWATPSRENVEIEPAGPVSVIRPVAVPSKVISEVALSTLNANVGELSLPALSSSLGGVGTGGAVAGMS